MIQSAKAFIGAFIEQAMLGGKISPPSGIFLMKNWLSYKDAISIEESIPKKDERRVLPADAPLDLRKWSIEQKEKEKLPQLDINSDYEEGENDI